MICTPILASTATKVTTDDVRHSILDGSNLSSRVVLKIVMEWVYKDVTITSVGLNLIVFILFVIFDVSLIPYLRRRD